MMRFKQSSEAGSSVPTATVFSQRTTRSQATTMQTVSATVKSSVLLTPSTLPQFLTIKV